jgi:uncharacterized membrane protein
MVTSASESVGDTREAGMAPIVNLGTNERIASAVLGGAFLLFGLNRLSVPALLMTAIGGAFLSRGVTGYCPLTPAEGRRDVSGRQGRLISGGAARGQSRSERRHSNAKSGR